MGSMKDLFDYPVGPGFAVGSATSQAAAAKVEPKITGGRAIVLEAFKAAGATGLTADQAAERTGQTILYVRPRVTELGALGKLKRKGETRTNESGQQADVWVIA